MWTIGTADFLIYHKFAAYDQEHVMQQTNLYGKDQGLYSQTVVRQFPYVRQSYGIDDASFAIHESTPHVAYDCRNRSVNLGHRGRKFKIGICRFTISIHVIIIIIYEFV